MIYKQNIQTTSTKHSSKMNLKVNFFISLKFVGRKLKTFLKTKNISSNRYNSIVNSTIRLWIYFLVGPIKYLVKSAKWVHSKSIQQIGRSHRDFCRIYSFVFIVQNRIRAKISVLLWIHNTIT